MNLITTAPRFCMGHLAICLLAAVWLMAGAGWSEATDGRQPDWLAEPAKAVFMDVMSLSCPHILTDRNMFRYVCRESEVPVAPDAARVGCGWRPTKVDIVVLGQPDFLAQNIDPGSLNLSGVSCVSSEVIDCGSAPSGLSEPFPCYDQVPDGRPDFVFRVQKQCLWQACSGARNGEEVVLVLRGKLREGTPFVSADVVRLRCTSPGQSPEVPDLPIVSLSEGRPNPFNPSTSFEIELSEPADYLMEVYDVIGRRVFSESGSAGAGSHTLIWNGIGKDGRPVATGVYFMRVTAGVAAAHRKVMLLK